MADHHDIYQEQAEKYELLISREDFRKNILPCLQEKLSLDGLDVVELGAGTGRLTTLLCPLVKSIYAFDGSQAMLDVAGSKLAKSPWTNWKLEVGDHRMLTASDASADLVISGWSICYIVVDHPDTWQEDLEKVFLEIKRILKPHGKIILLETLGTGFEQPMTPAHLEDYYRYLESYGFTRSWFRTDYLFKDINEARFLAGFFFGEEIVEKMVSTTQGVLLPECTGIWYLSF